MIFSYMTKVFYHEEMSDKIQKIDKSNTTHASRHLK